MFLFLVTLCLQVVYICSLDCYQCSNLQHHADCHNVVVCPGDTLCATESSVVGGNTVFNMSCKQRQDCPNLPSTQSPPSIIGRRVTRDTPCSECCSRDSCNKFLCSETTQLHGGWSLWTQWSACSVTCGVGLEKRRRNCSNPFPTNHCNDCIGDNVDDRICSLPDCFVVMFEARNVANTSPSDGEIVRYTTTMLNVGGGYNSNSGYFTAPYDGQYSFIVQVCSLPQKDVRVQIIAAGRVITAISDYGYDMPYHCASGDGAATLKAGDKVWTKYIYVSGVGSSISQNSEYWNGFSGELIHRTV